MKYIRLFALFLILCLANQACAQTDKPEMNISEEAKEIHHSGMLFDGHNDLPFAIRMKSASSFDKIDIAKPTELHTDIPRLRKGGLKAQFWSVFVPADTDLTGNALIMTLEQIQIVHDMCERYPDVFEMAATADDVERIVESGKIASLIGVEGGHSIQNSLQALRILYEKGARYMTLTHSKTLGWADSATDEPKNDGLSPFGKEVVREMNLLGMLIDLSHVSPKCMRDALEVTQAPVIFSHSSARAICDHARNVPDDMLKLTAENGGVVMVNFMSGYIVPTAVLEKNENARGDYKIVCDHIDHIVKIAGIDHVGIGSDYDGVRTLPVGLDDVSYYPNITQELLNRGYDKTQIHKILGGNVLRVMREAEKVSTRLKSEKSNPDLGEPFFAVTIEPMNYERKNLLVTVPFDPDNVTDGETAKIVTLRDESGSTYLGQVIVPSIGELTAEKKYDLTFVIPELPADKTLKLKVYKTGLSSYREFNWHDDGSTQAALHYGDQPVMTYMYEALDDSTEKRLGETYKVYHHVYTPDGSRLMTKGPGGLFPHHRGLFFGFNRISYTDPNDENSGEKKTADVWHCKNGASQSHARAISRVHGPVIGRDVNRIQWRGQDGKPFAEELREMSAYKIGGATIIDFTSHLATLGGPMKLDGDPQHAGFQFRASQDVPDKTKAKTFYIRPDGVGQPGKFRNWSNKPDETAQNKQHINLPWNALCIELPVERRKPGSWDEMESVNQKFTVCYFDHPDNPKPARFSEREYGRFGSYFERTVTKDNPLKLQYRMWIQEGEMSVEEIDALHNQFVDRPSASIDE